MSTIFVAVVTAALMGAVAIGQWIDRQCHGAAMDEWRGRWN